jgi:adenine-specific DNA-methyltransferase
MTKNKQDAFETFEFDLPPIRGFPELRWAGKRPFRSTQYFPAQKKEAYGDPTDGWWNRIYWGDNLQVMSHLLREFRGKVDLVYIDPPFDSKADYKKKISVRESDVVGDYQSFEERQYTDIWTHDGYAQFIYERLILIRELLSDEGSLYVHCDWHKSHHIRCLLDEVFGPDRLISEVAYKRRHAHGDSATIGTVHDTILIYSKTDQIKWTTQYEPYSDEYVETYYRYSDDDGRKWLSRSTTAPGGRGPVYEWNGHRRAWRYKREKMQELHDTGRIFYTKNGMARFKQYLDEMPGLAVTSMWTDVKFIDSWSAEDLGYPTQKSEDLLYRIIKQSSNPGDLVFDCFMGSGTTQAAAAKLGRRFIGADINLGAVETTTKRVNTIRQSILGDNAGLFDREDRESPTKFYTGFEVYNVNNYDLFRNPIEAKELIKEAMELQPLAPGSVFDGQHEEYLVKIMPVNRIATRADLNEVINGLDFKAFEARAAKAPNKPVERIHLVCMGHEPDLGPELEKAAKPFDIEVKVTDLIRDKAHLHFKRASDARLKIEDGYLVIAGFYPLNLLQKLSMEAEAVDDWRQLVESVKVDWNYDGAVLTPAIVDAPEKDELVTGSYPIPAQASTIRVKITDLLSESWEGDIENA